MGYIGLLLKYEHIVRYKLQFVKYICLI